MSRVFSYAVGNGDMFSIEHNADSFTIIDCSISSDNKDEILGMLKRQAAGKGISRFISTHPDQDHIMGISHLNSEMPIINFYCVKNKTKKNEVTNDFELYCQLRDSSKTFFAEKNCKRRWLNEGNQERDGAGIHFLWPNVNNFHYKEALRKAEYGESPNNISPIIQYFVENSGSFLWMGDLETEFMEKIENDVYWPKIDVLFAPHHGRKSGKVPTSILSKLAPKIIVIGEAQAKHLNYYQNYNTITQNSAGTILFECIDGCIHIYTSNVNYTVDFLYDYGLMSKDYLGTLDCY